MHYSELGRVEKPAAVESVRRDKVAPLLAAVPEVKPDIGCAKTAIGAGYDAMGRSHALAGPRGDVDDQARLAPVLRGGSAGDNLQRLDRVERNLVGKNLTLLVGDGLAIQGKRILRMVAHTMEEPIGIRRDAGSRQRDQRA